MKTKHFALSILGAVLLVAALLPSPPRGVEHAAIGAGSAVVLMSSQTAAGPGIATATSAVTPAEGGADRLIFQYHASASGVDVLIQESCDGTNWTPIYRFGRSGADETWSTGSAGVCAFRPYKNAASGTATVTLVMSGAGVAYAPTYTPTVTPTRTLTPTMTPTH